MKKQFKTLLALALVLALCCGLMAACAKTQEPAATPTSDTQPQQTEPVNSDQPDSPKEEEPEQTPEPEAEPEPEEPTEIVVTFLDLRRTAADYGDHVAEAIRAHCLEAANLDVEMHWVQIPDWQNNVMLGITSGERMDVIAAFAANSISSLYSRGLVRDIKTELETYASDALEMMKDYMNVATYDGGIYGMPAYRNYAKNSYIIMNAEVLDNLGLREKAENMTTFHEFEEILAAVKEAETDQGTGMYAFGSKSGLWSNEKLTHGDKFADIDVYDVLGDTTSSVHCADGKVENLFAMQDFADECARVADWRAQGYIWPDSSITDETQDGLMKQKVLFSVAMGSELGVEVTKAASYGYEVVCRQIAPGMIKTSQPLAWGCAVPINSEEPEAAAKFINLLYTDADLMNLLVWGVEGTDYTLEDGQVVQNPDGRFETTDFLVGNNLLLTPLKGNGTDFYQRVQATNESAPKSPYLGFAINTADMDMVLGQINAVNDQYRTDLISGNYTPELYDEYVTKLEAAGVQDYLDQIQAQLDAWLAAK